VDDLVLRTTYLEKDLSGVNRRVEGVANVTDDVRALRHQVQGAGTLGQWLIRFGISVVAFAGWLVGLYTWFTGRPPP
jgi:hypothetical protein